VLLNNRGKIAIVLIVIMLLGTAVSFGLPGTIVIDGYYDDWEDKPHTEVYQGNNPKPKVINHVAIFRDDDNLYVHILFSEQYNSGIKNMRIDVETNVGDGYYELEESAVYQKDILIVRPDGTADKLIEPGQEMEDAKRPGEAGGEDVPKVDSEDLPEEDSISGEIQGSDIDQDSGPSTENGRDNTEQVIPDAKPDVENEPIGLVKVHSLLSYLKDYLYAYAEDDDSESGEFSQSEETGDAENAGVDETRTDELEQGEALKQPSAAKPPKERIKEFNVMLGNTPVSTGYMTIVGTRTVEAEFSIPLYTIATPADGIADISMQIKKLGKQWLYWSGVSTAPYIGVTAAVLAAAIGIAPYRKRKGQTG